MENYNEDKTITTVQIDVTNTKVAMPLIKLGALICSVIIIVHSVETGVNDIKNAIEVNRVENAKIREQVDKMQAVITSMQKDLNNLNEWKETFLYNYPDHVMSLDKKNRK